MRTVRSPLPVSSLSSAAEIIFKDDEAPALDTIDPDVQKVFLKLKSEREEIEGACIRACACILSWPQIRLSSTDRRRSG